MRDAVSRTELTHPGHERNRRGTKKKCGLTIALLQALGKRARLMFSQRAPLPFPWPSFHYSPDIGHIITLVKVG